LTTVQLATPGGGDDAIAPCPQCGHDPVAAFIALSDERGRWLWRGRAERRAAFQCGADSMAGEYDRGFTDGLIAYKAAQHDACRGLQAELDRWNGPREDFGKPRPGEYTGGRATGWDTAVKRGGA